MDCLCRDKKDYGNAKQKYQICLDEAGEVSYSACLARRRLSALLAANLNLKTGDSNWLDSPTKVHRWGYSKKVGTRAPNKKAGKYIVQRRRNYVAQFELYLRWR